MNASHRTDTGARLILDINARLCNHIGHAPNLLLVRFSCGGKVHIVYQDIRGNRKQPRLCNDRLVTSYVRCLHSSREYGPAARMSSLESVAGVKITSTCIAISAALEGYGSAPASQVTWCPCRRTDARPDMQNESQRCEAL